MIDYRIDIPNLETVNLPDSFCNVRAKSVTSIDMNKYVMNRYFSYSR